MKKIVSILVIIVSFGISAFVIYSSYGKNTESEVFVFKRNNKVNDTILFLENIISPHRKIVFSLLKICIA